MSRNRGPLLLVLLLLLLTLTPGAARADAPAPFPDLAGHWAAPLVAQAVQAGFVNGYPDGNFRPDAPVTRAEYIKLLVTAGRLSDSRWGGRIFDDIDGHWIETSGLIYVACTYGVVVPGDYAFRYLNPDQPIPRREMAVMAGRLLGRQYQAGQLAGADLPLADQAAIPDWARGWVKLALDDGIVAGYPDGTFRPDQGATRAEAVAIVLRTLDAMNAGTDPSLHLVVGGQQVAAPLAVRGGLVYAPARAIYGTLGATKGFYSTETLYIHPANAAYILGSANLEFPAGAPFWVYHTYGAQESKVQTPLLGNSYLLYGELMVPAARTGGDGTLPYARTQYGAGVLRVDITANWPGNHLPTGPEQTTARLLFPGGGQQVTLEPGMQSSAPTLGIFDQAGERIVPFTPLTYRYQVDPENPLRLRPGAGAAPVTDVTATQGTPAVDIIVDDSQVPVPEGSFNLTVTVAGYAPFTTPIAVADHRPYTLAFDPIPTVAQGQTETITVRLLDRRGRLVDQSYAYTGPRLAVTQPDGSTVYATAQTTTDPVSERPMILVHGVAHYTYTPPAAGDYTYTVTWDLPVNPPLPVTVTAQATVPPN